MPTNNLSYPEQPLFSVIIPCYNQAELLSEALDSLISQEFTLWEAIVVNDGSPDNTNEIANRYANKDKRIRLFIKENGGLSSARNAGIKIAKGKWLLFLDADDSLLPDLFEILSNEVNNLSLETILHFGYQYISESGARIFHKIYPKKYDFLIPNVLKNNIGPCHSLIIQSEFASLIGEFDETLKSAEDWDFWIRAAKSGGEIKTINQILVNYRIQDYSMSRQPVIMLNALEVVFLRGLKKDNRLSDSLPLNRNYNEISSASSIKYFISMCVGVALIQDQIGIAKNIYKTKTDEYKLLWNLSDWAPICSYLSFRYRYSNDEIRKALYVYVPLVRRFFSEIGYGQKEISLLLKIIFCRHIKINNVRKWGVFGKLMNYIQFYQINS
jgi:glycosyltransferase involved in cell wall biosynthesis